MFKRFKAAIAALLAVLTLIPLSTTAKAKTLESAKAENIFVYVSDNDGTPVLSKIVTLDELKTISHGQADGGNYYISSTDNYPTTQYCEARGLTIPEFAEYAGLSFRSGDTVKLMATDSYGNYNRVWTYDELYGVQRYYFEGLFEAWTTAWEIASEDSSKYGLTLEEYNSTYRDTDPNYETKLAVFKGGVITEPILAVESYSGRTTTDALVASTEPGISDYIARNGGIAAGSLKDVLTDETALRLALPMTEADLFAAHRTSFDNFKWTYNLLFTGEYNVSALGTVAEPIVTAAVSGNTLSFNASCETSGAVIYYSFDGAPQQPYSGAVTVDITGRDIAKDPVTFYVTSVKEGYTDAGIITVKYPGLSPAFKTLYSGMAQTPLTFTAADAVTASDWQTWTDSITFVTIKEPGSVGYVRIDADKIAADNSAKTITLDASLFQQTGTYSFVFHSSGYADKNANITIKQPAGAVQLSKPAVAGQPLTFVFEDEGFKSGATLYVTPPSGERIMLTSAKLETYIPAVPGEYILSFVNTKYEPNELELTVTVYSEGSIPTEFLFFGDIQVEYSAAEDYDAWEKLAAVAVAENPNAQFALHAGDIVESGISTQQWDAFMTAKSNALGDLPFYPTNGNHESNFLSGKPEEYLRRFQLPQNGPDGFKGEFYSFDSGNTHISVLNSWVFSGEQKLTESELSELDAWVKNDLLSARTEWKIVLTHLPVFPVHTDADALKMSEHWLEIFEDCGVSLVFVGHQHVYSRLEPQNGLTQIMANSGLKFYDSADETLAARTIYNTATYQVVSVTSTELNVKTFDIDGNELDDVVINRLTRGQFAELHPKFKPLFIGYPGGDMGWGDYITAEQIRILNNRLEGRADND